MAYIEGSDYFEDGFTRARTRYKKGAWIEGSFQGIEYGPVDTEIRKEQRREEERKQIQAAIKAEEERKLQERRDIEKARDPIFLAQQDAKIKESIRKHREMLQRLMEKRNV